MEKDAKIYVAGHRGLAGSAIVRALKREGYSNLVTRTHVELDLRDQHATQDFFTQERPEYVFIAAAKVGGLKANNTYRADFIYDNLQIQNNLFQNAHEHNVRKLLYLGSNCMYPKACPQPMKEEHLFTGPLEPTNQPFAVAKIAGAEMCHAYTLQHKRNFIACIPASLYGPGDNYNMVHSHIIPTLIKRCHDAKIHGERAVTLEGGEDRRREMIYVDDMADACLFLMKSYDNPQPINIGVGEDYAIRELAESVANTVGFAGKILFDTLKPSGMRQKLLDSSRIHALGWRAKTPLSQGLKSAYDAYLTLRESSYG